LEKERKSATERHPQSIIEISVAGYKSILDEQPIEIRQLTVLAGANSSGKSSIIQPLLLLKQTLEVGYDPGALYLNGPNIKFNSTSQLFSKSGNMRLAERFQVGLKLGNGARLKLAFARRKEKGLNVIEAEYGDTKGRSFILKQSMSSEALTAELPPAFARFLDAFNDVQFIKKGAKSKSDATPQFRVGWVVSRDRCFLEPRMKVIEPGEQAIESAELDQDSLIELPPPFLPSDPFKSIIRKVIHVPGIRGNPARTYPVTAIGRSFPGLFQNYAASVIAQWQSQGRVEQIKGISADLETLGLTWRVFARSVQDTEVEIRVGRLGHKGEQVRDSVNIADVGLAMSQVLPVLVALRSAEPGQLVFIEQPELHLHPRAQIQLAKILAGAVRHGIQVLIETHSSLLLLAIQTLIAEDKLRAKDVKLHWFTRSSIGMTQITSADLDSNGSFGEWPEDFGAVNLDAENRYLTASERKSSGRL
jgi:predicted ATPase